MQARTLKVGLRACAVQVHSLYASAALCAPGQQAAHQTRPHHLGLLGPSDPVSSGQPQLASPRTPQADPIAGVAIGHQASPALATAQTTQAGLKQLARRRQSSLHARSQMALADGWGEACPCPCACCSQHTPTGKLICLATGALPMDLLRRALQAAIEQLQEDQQLAQLARLACVCRHWQAAAGEVARHFSTPHLSCRQLTPLLRGWAPGWTRLDLTLDAHGTPPGLEAFLRASSALACASLRGTGDSNQEDSATVERALAQVLALRELRCLTYRPAAFPRGLARLRLGPAVDWSGRLLEDLILKLQLVPLLEHIEIELDCPEVVLSEERLAHVELHFLKTFKLTLEKFEDDAVLDLSWLGSTWRDFAVTLVLLWDYSEDELLRFSESVSQVLHHRDELVLSHCSFICEAAQRRLAGLELTRFHMSVGYVESILALPSAYYVQVAFRLHDSDIGHARSAPAQLTVDMTWGAVTAAQVQLDVDLDLWLFDVHEPFAVDLEVAGCLSAGAAGTWEASLPLRSRTPWRGTFTGFAGVSGLPPATSQAPQRYVLANAACLALYGS